MEHDVVTPEGCDGETSRCPACGQAWEAEAGARGAVTLVLVLPILIVAALWLAPLLRTLLMGMVGDVAYLWLGPLAAIAGLTGLAAAVASTVVDRLAARRFSRAGCRGLPRARAR